MIGSPAQAEPLSRSAAFAPARRRRYRARLRLVTVSACGLALLGAWCPLKSSASARQLCNDVTFQDHGYVVCTVDVTTDALGLYLRGPDGRPYGTFTALAADLATRRRALAFGMNAGMYELDRSPVGLFVADGETRHPAETGTAQGNFYLKPNGVFFFGPHHVGIMETGAYLRADLHPTFATQSGPMLVIDGKLHPKFLPDATSLKIRNGVGVRAADTAIFAISKVPVSFFQFASLFRDKLGCRDALYLDGSVSTLYAPSLGRTSQWVSLGPMVAVTVPQGAP